MNEVGHIADEVRSGAAVTKSQAFARVVQFYKLGMGTGGPTLFVSDAFRAWAPDTWEKMADSRSRGQSAGEVDDAIQHPDRDTSD